MTFPPTRTYVCFKEGPESPDSQACKDAVAQGGTQPLYDWFALLISNAAGQHQAIIPDGQLCGAGTAKYAAYNMARADWPTTEVTAGANITFRYNAWAPHPGTWSQYITKDGFDITQPLTWADLDPVPFDEVTNPPINGSSADGAEYTWPGTLPNKTGRHIIYSIWQRSDSPEAFYNCSDVEFGSGGGTPTAAPTSAAPTSTPSDAAPTTEPTATEPTPSSAVPTESAAPTGSPSSSPSTAVPAAGAGSCTATVDVHGTWAGGFNAQVTVTNTGTTAISPWSVSWTLPGGGSIASAWNAAVTQSGTTVTATAPSWNQSLSPGKSASIGFVANGTPAPTALSLNGASCG